MENTSNKRKVGIKDLFKQKKFIVLLFGSFISRFGDSLDAIAYSLMVYHLTGSKILLATLYIVNCIPSIILSPFAGVVADRISKKKGIVVCDIGRGIVVSITAFLLLTNKLEPWHLYIFTFINSTFESFAKPSKTALIPNILPEELFLTASSFSSSLSSFAEIIGAGLAGFIIVLVGFSGAIFIDGLTFFISAIIIFSLKIKEHEPVKKSLGVKSYITDLLEGLNTIKNMPVILIVVLLFGFINFFLAPINILLPAYATDILYATPKEYSLISLALPIGVILGGLITSQFGSKFKKGYLVSFGMSLLGIFCALLCLPGKIDIPLVSPVLFVAIVFFMIGVSMPICTSPLSVYMLSKIPKDKLGRVSALFGMFATAAMPLGGGLSGVVSELISMQSLFLIVGLSIAVVSLLPLLNKTFRTE